MGSKQSKSAPTGNLPARRQWEQILEQAWRPAWSIRSRKGCLEPFIAWWRQRRTGGSEDNAGSSARDE